MIDYLKEAKRPTAHPDTSIACALIAIAEELRRFNDGRPKPVNINNAMSEYTIEQQQRLRQVLKGQP